ncbi:Xaa-Pro aminopeptidase 2 [Portunus trituberculatus]|uniref:Xaa-Pro aminopeptidase 2 n=1 Tax=Portunus trituberculatus TaxID=210409 RepID=A0A5B7K939_PORTR|nr:Xaa-Pro aminopeptidase 2 [Portunus trituberculatus]
MSFETISAFGPNGAVIHYRPRQDTKLHITADNLYLVDSGGQYKAYLCPTDGTTDVTRTMHYGTPTPMQVEAYTRVLMGAIDLATLVFPEGTGDTDVDILARR